MDSDFDDMEDDKSKVRSLMDALGDATNHGKKRGRPRKSGGITPNPSSSRRAKSSDESEHDDNASNDDGDESDSQLPAKKRRGSEDEDWNEYRELLSKTEQRRTRKKPTLYSEESVASEQRRKQESKRRSQGSNGSRGRPRLSVGPSTTNGRQPTYNKKVELSKEDQDALARVKQQWADIERPMHAKQRVLPQLRRGLFEKGLERMQPVPDPKNKSALIEPVQKLFAKLTCSAGFLQFINSIPQNAVVAIYDICEKLFVISQSLPDNMKIAQALRFWWNCLSFATRRKWEKYARSLVYGGTVHPDAYMRDCAAASEVPVDPSPKRLNDEELWKEMHYRMIGMLDDVETAIFCPLCEKEGEAPACKMNTIKDIQEHFFHHHWAVHGYACHFCGMVFSTADELMASHSDCQEWVAWTAASLLAGGSKSGQLSMSYCRMLLCCADCGWYTTLRRTGVVKQEAAKMSYLKTFMSYHNNDGLLAMVVYFAGVPGEEVESLRLSVSSMVGGDPQAPCVHCENAQPFVDPAEANEHYMREHKDKPLVCEECKAHTTTQYLLKQHQMTHVHDNAYFADFLSNSARIFPPPTNLSNAPRCGWRERAKGENYAYGGLTRPITVNGGVDLVDPMEDTTQEKTRLIRQRRKHGKPALDGGYEYAPIAEESSMARKVREKALNKYADHLGLRDDMTWLRDDDARKFKEWMDYWESAEGKRAGGPPKRVECDVTPSYMRIPAVEVELQFKDIDVLSGFLLNENVFYCMECDSILKGQQAFDHLEASDKCATNTDGQVEKDPNRNDNMYHIYSFAVSAPDAALPCPHCQFKGCSISAIRVHAMRAHGIFVKYERLANENVTAVVALRFDIRSRLAKTLDAKLGMLPSGMLPQQQPLVSDPSALSDHTWNQVIATRENTPASVLSNMKQMADDGWSVAPKVTPKQPPAHHRHYAYRDGVATAAAAGAATARVQQHLATYNQQYQRQMQTMPVRIAPPTPHLQQSPFLTFEQQLQLGTPMRGVVRGRPMNYLPPGSVVRQGVVLAPAGRGGTTMAGASRYTAPAPVAVTRKMCQFSHRDGDKDHFVCLICPNSPNYEREMVKSHLMRFHFHTCGHCTASFVHEAEARIHSRKCRRGRDSRKYTPDPRLAHIRTRCPFRDGCGAELPMVEMHMHLLDNHLTSIEYNPHDTRLAHHIQLVQKGGQMAKEPEVERLRYKYHVPTPEMGTACGYQPCLVCGLMFPDQAKLTIHLKYHPEFLYYCWVCPRTGSPSLGQVSATVRHLKVAHLKDESRAANYLPCPLCQVNMIGRPLQHLLYECEHNFVCQLCRDLPSFENADELKEHREKCHYNSIRRFECSHCAMFFATTADFTRHDCDTTMMKTTCCCGMVFRTRALFVHHFRKDHIRNEECTVCHARYKMGEEQLRHIHSHGKIGQPTVDRHLLMCAYGDVSAELKTLFTATSNASFRLRGVRAGSGSKGGGTENEPLTLSDDDDDCIIEVPSTAVQQERQQAAAAAARVPTQLAPPAAAVNEAPAEPASIEEDVAPVLKKIVNAIVKSFELEESRERRSREQSEQAAEAPMEPITMADVEYEDDDIVMLDDDDVGAAAESAQNLTARVRVESMDEADDVAAVGGQNQPGYKDDEEEKAGEGGTPVQAVLREFTPDDDDELCVVAEVENPGCMGAAATLNKQREKKFHCSKCSSRFMTQRTLEEHLTTEHTFDAGQSTIMEELGLPLATFVWICKSCCLAFQTEQQKRNHAIQHGQRTFTCENCSGCAYNMEVMSQHNRRVAERKVSYICGECKLEFDHETSLHEHSCQRHSVPLLYFCKSCEIGSTDGGEIYRHFMAGCPHDPHSRRRIHEEAVKCIGVCPAAQLHYQPTELGYYKEAHAMNPMKFVVPSLCNHRSLIVATERQVSCNECRCLEAHTRHMAFLPEAASKMFDAQVRHTRAQLPLQLLKNLFDNQQMHQHMYRQQQSRSSPSQGHGSGRVYQVSSGANGGSVTVRGFGGNGMSAHATQEAQRRLNDRLQAVHMARGGGGGQHGGPGGARPPVLTAGTVGGHLHNGGPAILRAPVQPQYVRVWPTPGMHLQQQQFINSGFSAMPSLRAPSVAPTGLSTMGSLQAIAAAAGSRQQTVDAATPSPPEVFRSSTCATCGATLLSPRDVFLHTLHTSSRGVFVCARCPIAIRDERSAVKHIVNHIDPQDRDPEMVLQCPFPGCSSELATLLTLKHHISAHNPPLRHTTKACHLTFGSKALADTHEEIHAQSDRRNECCILCGTMENWNQEMVDTRGKSTTITHTMKHAFKHLYYCKLCDMKQFEEESQIITHYMMFHSREDGGASSTRTCSDCNFTMTTDNDHKVHCLQKHTVTELFVPDRLLVRTPQVFSDHLGVGLDEPIPDPR